MLSVAHMLGQILLDDGATFVAHLCDVIASRVLDRLMEGKGDGPRRDVKGAAWHDLVAAVDGNGHYRKPELQGEFEGSVFEGAHLTRIGATSLRKDNDRHAAMQFLFGGGHGVAKALGRVGIHKDVARHAASSPDEGNVGDALAHHPFEVVSQETVNGKDIIGPLVIGDKHIARLMVNEFATHHLDTHQVKPAPYSGPPLGREIAPIVLVEQRADNGDKRSNNTEHQHDGRDDAPLVYAVKVYHVLINLLFVVQR